MSEKKVEKKISIPTMICVVLLALSVFGNIMLLVRNLGLSAITEIQDGQIEELEESIEGLNDYIHQLEKANLAGHATLSWSDVNFEFKGYIYNCGLKTAYDVSVTLYLYNNGLVVYSKKTTLGDIAGGSSEDFDTSFTFTDAFSDWDWKINF